MYLIGLDPLGVYAPADLTQGRAAGLGDRAADSTGNEFVFVLAGAGGLTGDGYVAFFDPTYTALQISTANDARGQLCGVAKIAVPAGSYCWLQVKGIANAQVLASAAANTRLNTTGTAGALDDDATAGSMQVQGIYLTTARAASPGTAPCVLNYPFVDVTL